jgi:hypothetical protein
LLRRTERQRPDQHRPHDPPLQQGVPIELNAGTSVQAAGHTDASADYQLTLVDLTARYRLAPDQKIDPRLGASLTYLNFDSDDPRLPDAMLDTSLASRLRRLRKPVRLAGGPHRRRRLRRRRRPRRQLLLRRQRLVPQGLLRPRKKYNKTDAILLVLDYDANRTYKPDIPFPGVAFQKLIFGNPDPDVTGGPFAPQLLLTLGLPYTAIHWEPYDRLSFDVSYLIPDDFTARIDYDLATKRRTLGVYAGLDFRRNAFHANTLRHGDDRILFYQRRAEVGVRWTPTRHSTSRPPPATPSARNSPPASTPPTTTN